MNSPSFSQASVLRAMRRKEWMENRAAVLVGLIIFVGLPTLWTLLLWSLETHTGVQPRIASTLWLFAGGLFASVLGAQVICRDFGAPTERFLLSRPVSTAQIIRAKIWSGLATVAIIGMSVTAVEFIWWTFRQKPIHQMDEFTAEQAIFGTGISICTYWIAAVAACVTRRALGSTLVAVFVLVMFSTLPLIIRIPWAEDLYRVVKRFEGTSFALLVTGIIVVPTIFTCQCVIRFFSIQNYRIDAGPRALAWLISLSLCALFLLAMRQVGASASLSTTWWINDPAARMTADGECYLFDLATGRSRIGVAYGGSGLRSQSHNTHFFFDIDADGRISKQRNVKLALDRLSTYSASMIDPNGNYACVGMSRIGTPPFKVSDPWKMTLYTFDWNSTLQSSAVELPWPVSTDWALVLDIARRGPRVYVLIRTATERGQFNNVEGVVATYQIQSNVATLESTSPFHFSISDSSLEPAWRLVPLFKSREAIRILAKRDYLMELQFLDGPDDYTSIEVDSKRSRLAIFSYPRYSNKGTKLPTDWEGAIGSIRATPWSLLFRSNTPFVIPADEGRLLEVHDTNIVEYDITDPTNPRRAANFAIPRVSTASTTGDLIVIQHYGAGFSIARMPSVKSQ